MFEVHAASCLYVSVSLSVCNNLVTAECIVIIFYNSECYLNLAVEFNFG
jgi:hypothetical protein